MQAHQHFLTFGTDGEFFFEGWKTGDNAALFILALLFTLAFGAFVSVVIFRAHQRRALFLWEPCIEFFAMYLVMTYNFWVVLAYVLGRTGGYAWAFIQRQITLK